MSSFIDMIIRSLEHLQITHCAQLSSVCIVLYEHLITLDDEIDLIWRSSWSPVKIVFLANRYYVLAAISLNTYALLGLGKLTDSLSVQQFFDSRVTHQVTQGSNYYRWQAWTELVSYILADGILQMRLYAMYSMDKRMLAAMLTCFAFAMGVSGYILNYTISNITAAAIQSPLGGMVCYPSHLTPKFYLFWIPLISFECLLCGLAVFRGLQTLRRNGSFARNLMLILIRDAVLYFFGICLTYAACLTFGILAPVTLLDVPIVFSIAMPCVLSNRVVLNLRAARQLPYDRGIVLMNQ